MFVFAYAPYVTAEGVGLSGTCERMRNTRTHTKYKTTEAYRLSSMHMCWSVAAGIVAIIFAAIVMSHYTAYNLSPISRLALDRFTRAFALLAGTPDTRASCQLNVNKIYAKLQCVLHRSSVDTIYKKRACLRTWALPCLRLSTTLTSA